MLAINLEPTCHCVADAASIRGIELINTICGKLTEPNATQSDQAWSATGARKAGELDFQSLVDDHYASLYRFALSLTRSESDAGDLVQETFLTWAKKGHQLENASKVKSWLFTTLHRRFLMTEQRSTRFPHFELCDAQEDLPRIEPESSNRLDAEELLKRLTQMDPHHRAAVALFYLEDCSYKEIAGILEIPIGTVKSRIARGLTRLRELISDFCS